MFIGRIEMNKLLVRSALACGALLVGSGTALAADPQDNPSGFYVGAGWGQFNLDIDNVEELGSSISNVAKGDDDAWKIFAGYRVNPYLSFEAAYIDFGAPSNGFDTAGTHGNFTADISGFAPYIIGTLPLGPVELFLKAGYYYYDVDVAVDLDSPGPGFDSSSSENDFLWGGGVGVTVFDHLHLRAEYEAVDIERADKADAIWLSGAWRF
jgi:opacity protein-like surface antigen